LLGGGAVRLVQGDYDRRVQADADAAGMARSFVAAGCRRLHVVDLEGARAGRPMQLDSAVAVAVAARDVSPDARLELGGGLRTEADVDAALEVADEAVLGTAAVESPGFVERCARRHPGRIFVSLDLRGDRAALDGWRRDVPTDPAELARSLVDAGAARLIVTDTSRDGTLGGPNVELLASLRRALPDAVLVAAGGIGSLDDLRALEAAGCDGAIVGLAVLTGRIDPATALAALA
jgi:phosphoribosylformimino-5-aminoimidazole carboxamide ribotide isomerase